MCMLVLTSMFLCSLIWPLRTFGEDNRHILQATLEAMEANAASWDNLQAEWEETRSEYGNQLRIQHRFWSRGGKYFRLDSNSIGSAVEGSTSENERIIVRPEGFARMTSRNGGPFALVDFGTSDEGIARLYSTLLFKSDQRGHLAYTRDTLQAMMSESPTYSLDKLIQDGHETKLTVSATSDDANYTYEHSLRTDVGCCTGWTETEKRDGRVVSKTSIKKTYSDSCIPRLIRVVSESNSSRWSQEFRLVSIDETAAELGIFSLDAQGVGSQGNVWIRRLVMVVVGIAILGGFFAYRRMKNHG